MQGPGHDFVSQLNPSRTTKKHSQIKITDAVRSLIPNHSINVNDSGILVRFSPLRPVGPKRKLRKTLNSEALSLNISRHQAREQLRIDIAAGEHGDRNLVLHVDLAGQQRREPDRAARLDHQLELAESEGDRARDVLVACGNAIADESAIDLKRQLARRLRHQCITDGAGDRRIAFALAALE